MKYLTHPLYGVFAFLVGAIMSDFMGIRGAGDFIAYLGIAYVLISVSIILFNYRTRLSLNQAFDDMGETKARDIPHKSTDRLKRRLLASLVLFIIPVSLHSIIFFIASSFDPCNDNPGCMAGSASAYFLIFISIPTLIILLIITLFQVCGAGHKHKQYLLINTGVSITPFFIAPLVFFALKLNT